MTDKNKPTNIKGRSPNWWIRQLQKLQLVARLTLDRRVPFLLKGLPLLAASYLLSPIDLIPEVLVLILGPLVVLDDVAIVFLMLATFIKLSPSEVVDQLQQEIAPDAEWPSDDQPYEATDNQTGGESSTVVEGEYKIVDDD